VSHDRWLDQVPAYSLGALDVEELAVFAAHLEGCSDCRRELADYEWAVAALADAVPRATPPDALRARLIAAASDRDARGRSPETGVDPIAIRARWAYWLATAASLAFAIWAGAGYLTARADRVALSAELETASTLIAALEVEQMRRDSLLAALVGTRIETATLASTGNEPRVRLFRNRGNNLLLVTAFDLPAAPAGRTYQIWGLAPESDPVSLGVFNTGPDGTAVVVRSLAAAGGYAQSAITDEPAGGSAQPTTQPFLVGAWAAGQ
jgi:anti-sigma-K factor RskA